MLSKRAQNLKPSPTLALSAKAKELKANGEDVISLSVGEPDWDAFEVVKKAAIEAIKSGASKYTPANGIPELRQCIAEQTNRDLDTSYSAMDVTVTSGGKFVIFAGIQAVVDPGDEVLIPAPYWVSYPTMVELADGHPITIECREKNNFKLSPEQLESHITGKTKVLILNSPSNPTGFMYSKTELEGISQVLLKHPQVLVISDDIYNRLVFDRGLAPHLLQVCPELKNRTLVMNGASKTYSMTGLRVGWALGPEAWVKAMTKFQSQSVSQAATPSQFATVAAIRDGKPELEAKLKVLKIRRDLAVSALNEIDGVSVKSPDGAFYLWPDMTGFLNRKFRGKSLSSSRDLSACLLESEKVAVVPGIEFGLEGFVRLSYALSEGRVLEAIQRIKNFSSQLD